MILTLLGRISSGGKGDGEGNFGEENQNIKKIGWGRISSFGKLYTLGRT